MFRPTLVITGAALAAFFATAVPAMAQNSQVMANKDKCRAMQAQFNDAKTDNQAAIALRKKAGQECAGSSASKTEQGVSDYRAALRMIGVKPDYNYSAK